MIVTTIKQLVAEKIFPFELYMSGKFNHEDIIDAMCQMSDLFESLYAETFIAANGITSLKKREENNAKEEID